MAWLPAITQITFFVCGLCFLGGGGFALYFKDDPSKTSMPPGKAWGLVAAGVVILIFAFYVRRMLF